MYAGFPLHIFVHTCMLLCLADHAYTLALAPRWNTALLFPRVGQVLASLKTAPLSSCTCVSRRASVLASLPPGEAWRDSRSRLVERISDLSFSFSWRCWQ